MKTVKILLIAIIAAASIGCEEDDLKASLHGQWKLIKTEGGISGGETEFPNGLITWNFDSASTTVQVINGNTDPNVCDVLDSGTYDYSLETNTTNNSCSKMLVIDDLEQGCHSVTATQLIITQPEADGYVLTFTR